MFIALNTVRAAVFTGDAGGGAIEYLTMVYITFFFATALYMKMRKILKTLLEKEFTGSQKRASRAAASASTSAGHTRSLRDHEGSDDEHAAAQHALLHGDDDDNVAKEHKKLFWFGKPGFVSRSVQFITLMIALLMPLYITYFSVHWAHDVDTGEEFTLTVATLLPMFIIVFVYLPWILPNYVFCTSIGEMYNEEAMKEAIFKTQSYIAEHGVHKHKHHHDHAAVIKSEHHGHGGHGHGGHGGHDDHGDHGGGHGGGHGGDDHGDHGGHGGGHGDHRSGSRGSASHASRRSKSQEPHDEHH